MAFSPALKQLLRAADVGSDGSCASYIRTTDSSIATRTGGHRRGVAAARLS
jgi:hypothetical protein